jgi:myo-inositol-1-phosphate synthase
VGGIGGAPDTPSSYFMKSPPEQYTDDVAHAKLETFIAGSDHRRQPEFEPMLSATPAI